MSLNLLLDHCEFAQPKKYSGRNELIVAILACLIWFSAVIIRLNFSGSQQWTNLEKILEATSTVFFCGLPVFFLATPQGSRIAKKNLLENAGLLFQVLVCVALTIYISVVKFLSLNPIHFVWLNQINSLIFEDKFWLNTVLFIAGVFVGLRIPFLMLKLRISKEVKTNKNFIAVARLNSQLLLLLGINFVYLVLTHTSLISSNYNSNQFEGYYIGLGYILVFLLMTSPICKRTSNQKLMIFDLFLIIACLGILFYFSMPFFSFGTFMSINLFVLVIVYGLELGREHFGYSFQVRLLDLKYLLYHLPLVILILVPPAVLLGFVKPAHLLGSRSEILNLSAYAVLFSFRVGIFEEIFFRSGLMVFIRDQLNERAKAKLTNQIITCYSAVICSVVFGISHVGNNPGPESLLSSSEYKLVYVLLAVLASLFYSFAFGETNRLWCSITIHGFVDTVAVVLLGGFLTVPF